jgi:hypothetical protein
MTCDVWKHVTELAAYLEKQFENTGSHILSDDSYAWHNSLFTSNKYRRAHVEIVDNRVSHKIYILHCTIFPHTDDSSPIWGFDIVCGPSKITGAFHDFSSVTAAVHPMQQWFANTTGKLNWNKPRALPEWAQQIFSANMVAVGNINTEEEIIALCQLAKQSLAYYLSTVGLSRSEDKVYTAGQNHYCHWQKQNPHVVRSMVSMGIPEPIILQFVDKILFPEIN